MIVQAYAKINLSLVVCSRLENGYHELKMVMENISLHDDLIVERSSVPGIHLSCVFEGGLENKGYSLSTDEDNLIIRAGNALIDHFNGNGITDPLVKTPDRTPGFDVLLKKRIPMAAGLAGGSTDAAAMLRAIAALYDQKDTADGPYNIITEEELCSIGARIGADIPYCILGKSRLAEGIGEILTPLPAPPKAYLLIVKPEIDVSTAHIYKMTDENTDYAAQSRSIVADRFNALTDALNSGDLRAVAANLHNDLRYAAISEHPVISEIENDLTQFGATGAMMSGSGPSVFAIFDDEDRCNDAYLKYQQKWPEHFITQVGFIV